jgi:transposase-like protein
MSDALSYRPPDDAHVGIYLSVEESLQRATTLLNYILQRLKTGNLQVTPDEAASLQAQIQELVLQAAAVGSCIVRQQQQRPPGQSH